MRGNLTVAPGIATPSAGNSLFRRLQFLTKETIYHVTPT